MKITTRSSGEIFSLETEQSGAARRPLRDDKHTFLSANLAGLVTNLP